MITRRKKRNYGNTNEYFKYINELINLRKEKQVKIAQNQKNNEKEA